MPTAAELLIQIKTAGADELAKVATAVESVGAGTRLAGSALKTFDATLNSLVASGKTYEQALKEMAASQGVLSSSIVGTSKALLAHMGVVEEVEVATHRLVGANIAAGAAIRDMTGQSNIRAVENLLSNVLGLGSAFQTLFPLVGAYALGEELYKLYEHFDPLKVATKELADENKKLDQTYVTATANIERYIEAQARATLGASAARSVGAYDAGTQRLEAVYGLADIQKKIDDKESQRFHTVYHNVGESNAVATREEDPVVAKQIQTLQDKADAFRILIREFDAKAQADKDEAAKDKAREDKEAGRPAAELKKRQAEELLKIRKELDALTAKELVGEDKIRATRQAIIDQLQAEHLIKADGLALEQQITEELIKQFHTKMGKDAVALGNAFVENQSHYREKQDKADLAVFARTATYDNTADERDATAMRAIEAKADEAEAERIRRSATEPNPRVGRRNSTDDAVARELRNYQAQLNASDKILANDTRRLDIAKLDADLAKHRADLEFHLSQDEWADETKLADARKKHADEIYTIQQQHRAALAAEQQADLQKYESEASRIFDALTSGQHGSVASLVKSAVMGQGRQVFSNILSPVLQTAGHSIAGITGGHSYPALAGTLLDPKNASIDVAKRTEDHTRDIADNTKGLLTLMSGNGSTDPHTATGIAGTGRAAAGGGGFLGTVGRMIGLGSTRSAFTTPSIGYTSDSLPSLDYDPYAGLPVSMPGSTDNGGNYDSTVGLPSGVSSKMSVASMIGSAATIAAGALAVGQGISKGGAQGALQAAGGAAAAVGTAVSSVAKLVGALSPALAAAGPIGAAVGAGLGIISSFIPNGPAIRAKQISDELSKNQYMAPTALNVTQSSNGTYADFDSHGLLNTSTLRAVPTVAESYVTSKRFDGTLQYEDAPGSTIKPYSGSATGSGRVPQSNAGTTIIIQAMDAQSFHEYLQAPGNAHAVGESVASHLEQHEGRLSQGIRYITGTDRKG